MAFIVTQRQEAQLSIKPVKTSHFNWFKISFIITEAIVRNGCARTILAQQLSEDEGRHTSCTGTELLGLNNPSMNKM